ncbi:hypothetical protein VPH35_117758 [Triticum aestivum]
MFGWVEKSLFRFSAFGRQYKSFGSALLFYVTMLSDTALHFRENVRSRLDTESCPLSIHSWLSQTKNIFWRKYWKHRFPILRIENDTNVEPNASYISSSVPLGKYGMIMYQ